jgi:hypothetical protein
MLPIRNSLLRRAFKIVRTRISMSTYFGSAPEKKLSELNIRIRGLQFCLKNDGSTPSDDISAVVSQNTGYDDVQSLLTRFEAERSSLIANNQSK